MATYTSYYNLTKPAGTERVNIAIINQNMDAIDTQMHKNAQSIIANHGGMAIPSNNNTHAAVSSGQYVYVYNHSSLSEGLYIAKSAISTNGALSLSNLTAVSNGGLNHVYNTLNSNIANAQAGTYYLPNLHCVYAGRNGWGGLNIRTSIPINKGSSGLSSATINLNGATVYACTNNGVYDITSSISSISCNFSGSGILTAIAVTIVLSSNPLPFSDGIVNIAINGGTPTITLA